MTAYYFTLHKRLSELHISNEGELDLVYFPRRLSRLPDFSCLGPRSCSRFCVFMTLDVLTSPESKQRDLPRALRPSGLTQQLTSKAGWSRCSACVRSGATGLKASINHPVKNTSTSSLVAHLHICCW